VLGHRGSSVSCRGEHLVRRALGEELIAGRGPVEVAAVSLREALARAEA
jgi:hypothetical protein